MKAIELWNPYVESEVWNLDIFLLWFDRGSEVGFILVCCGAFKFQNLYILLVFDVFFGTSGFQNMDFWGILEILSGFVSKAWGVVNNLIFIEVKSTH